MGTNRNAIESIIQSKGFSLSFEPKLAGAVVCRACKGASRFEVLARSASDGILELARLLGVQGAWHLCR